jgi:hypothetical protein
MLLPMPTNGFDPDQIAAEYRDAIGGRDNQTASAPAPRSAPRPMSGCVTVARRRFPPLARTSDKLRPHDRNLP